MTERESAPLERRRLLGLLGTGAFAGLAGCSGGDDEDDDNGDSDDGPSFEPNMEHPGDGPVEFSSSHSCPVCTMTPTDYPRWHSQLAHEDGAGAVFDAPGCMFAYLVAHTSDSEIAGAWTMDHANRDLIDATDAYFVRITDDDAADDPMGIEPRPFAEEEDALEFLEEWEAEDLTEDDIIGLDDVDEDVAKIYRARYF